MSQFVNELLTTIHNLSSLDPEDYHLADCKEELEEDFTVSELSQLAQNLQDLKTLVNSIKRKKLKGG